VVAQPVVVHLLFELVAEATPAEPPEPLGRVPADMPPEEGAKLGLETTVAVMKKAGVA